jgi:hypothetical protein
MNTSSCPKDSDALGFAVPAQANEATTQGPFSEQLVWETLKKVYDPEIPPSGVSKGRLAIMTSSTLGQRLFLCL